MHNIENSLEAVRQRIQSACAACSRPVTDVSLLAVSKTQPAAAVRAAYNAGQRAFGENYLQEALDKQAELGDLPLEWHFIGPIQSNKTRAIAEHFSWVHSIDRYKIAHRLNEQRGDYSDTPLNICLQVNIDDETSKSGVSAQALLPLATEIATLSHLRLRGLMAIPAPTTAPATQREAFAKVRKLREELQQALPEQCWDTLSMGMSGDLEAAIYEGATMVRIGTDIFGRRQAS